MIGSAPGDYGLNAPGDYGLNSQLLRTSIRLNPDLASPGHSETNSECG
jgi:hypothetical protein